MESILLTIKDEGKAINPTELAEFLYLFQGANVALQQVTSINHRLRQPTEAEIAAAKSEIASFSPRQLDSIFDPKRAKDLLQIGSISRQSPLEIVVMGCLSLLTIAVVFSGGKIEILKVVKAQLPPLGHGVKSLRDALVTCSLNRWTEVGSGCNLGAWQDLSAVWKWIPINAKSWNRWCGRPQRRSAACSGLVSSWLAQRGFRSKRLPGGWVCAAAS